mmetsp:Transcript_12805/g.23267  ORF Transcript_12805/g.23267 Transcript_12805/m.23267 type:complete len:308 (-) Transcript_12805:17-940(-)
MSMALQLLFARGTCAGRRTVKRCNPQARWFNWKVPPKQQRQPIYQQRKEIPTATKAKIVVVAGICGGAVFMILRNMFNPPVVYEPKVPELDRSSLGLPPAEYASLLKSKDSVRILSADLTHLRAKILTFEDGSNVTLSGKEASSTHSGVTRYTPVYGPELLISLAVSPHILKEVAYKHRGASLVIFNPKDVDDQLFALTWPNILDIYIYKVFGSNKFTEIRECTRKHRAQLITTPLLLEAGKAKEADLPVSDFLQGAKDSSSTRRLIRTHLGLLENNGTGLPCIRNLQSCMHAIRTYSYHRPITLLH